MWNFLGVFGKSHTQKQLRSWLHTSSSLSSSSLWQRNSGVALQLCAMQWCYCAILSPLKKRESRNLAAGHAGPWDGFRWRKAERLESSMFSTRFTENNDKKKKIFSRPLGKQCETLVWVQAELKAGFVPAQSYPPSCEDTIAWHRKCASVDCRCSFLTLSHEQMTQ